MKLAGILASVVRPLVRRAGFDVVRYQESALRYPRDVSEANAAIYEAVKPYTMTSLERVNALVDAVQYVVRKGVEGAMVECGVWKGGSSMAVALALQAMNVEDRPLYLYDTFSGMVAPGEADVSVTGVRADEKFARTRTAEDESDWCLSPLEEVRAHLFSTRYPKDRIHFVQGKVEDVLPERAPEKIALLRLDTDWYASTKHELVHLFPRLQPNGVLILDDYGHWQGARKAADEYFRENDIQVLLHRIDNTGRIAVKA